VVEGNCEVILETTPLLSAVFKNGYFSAYRLKNLQPKASTKKRITLLYLVGRFPKASMGKALSPSPDSINSIVCGRAAKQYESYNGLTNLCENFAPFTAFTDPELSIGLLLPAGVRGIVSPGQT
jgi:hypothetical protein